MSIALITDGMLYPIIVHYIQDVSAPDDAKALVGDIPTVPCKAEATDPALTPPKPPTRAQATGPSVPVAPCGTTGYDPTIDPPKVPQSPEASEDLGNEAPAVPKCPEGRES